MLFTLPRRVGLPATAPGDWLATRPRGQRALVIHQVDDQLARALVPGLALPLEA